MLNVGATFFHEVNVNEVSQAKYAIGQDGGCGRNDLELQNIDHLSSVFRSELHRSTEYSCNPTDGQSDDDDAVLLMSLAISAPTWLSGLQEGVVQRSKYQQNCQESHQSNL